MVETTALPTSNASTEGAVEGTSGGPKQVQRRLRNSLMVWKDGRESARAGCMATVIVAVRGKIFEAVVSWESGWMRRNVRETIQ